MKETMETLKCKAVHVAAGAAQTARLVALISKKKFAILAEQDKIRRCYTQLGKVYYKTTSRMKSRMTPSTTAV